MADQKSTILADDLKK